MLKISGSTLLKVYLYLISFITLTIAMFTGAIVLKATASYVSPLQFSYYLYEPNNEDAIKQAEKDGYVLEECYNGEVIDIDGKNYCWDETDRKQDLINGLSIFISMLILFGLHQFGIKKSEKDKTPQWLIKGYSFLSLFTYGITGIIAIPTAIYQTTNYFLATELGEAPAYSIGLVILVIPLWYIFFKKTLKLKDE